ncbi:hypothetical protein HMPREF9103_01801 [Lentilactobacillus parafarraginis F0439]|uniref:Uncharacterized protein n=1 Tax=Lentilactobacillus parafarraginis F0439 TaxID=797515 RepID=G9ZPZ6_9LACO|nr:hypothetical protein HMPREF9103_01801 [Lentilactobacillus parafarraginis F0439]
MTDNDILCQTSSSLAEKHLHDSQNQIPITKNYQSHLIKNDYARLATDLISGNTKVHFTNRL